MSKRETGGVEVLLAGGDDRSMLSAARSLSRHGVSFLVVGLKHPSFVGTSRHVHNVVAGRAPNPGLEPRAYVEFILDLVRRNDARLVLPLTDKTLRACDLHRELIEAETRLAAASSDAVRNVLDKRVHLDTARRLGIPCPDQYELESVDGIPELIDRLGFPLVLKDPGPSVDGSPSPFDFAWLIAWNRADLDRYLAKRCRPGTFPLFQKLVTGDVRNVCCFADQGKVVAINEYRDLRRLVGLSVFREMTSVTPELRRYTESMIQELKWDGPAHLEFFVREGDGDVRYMETNGRFWASLEGPVSAGWDYPWWTYEYFADGVTPQPPPESLWLGKRSCWRYGDLTALLRFLRGEYEATGAGRSKTRAVVDYLTAFRPGIGSDVFRFDDPVPEIVEHWIGGRLALSRWHHRHDASE